MKVKNVYGYIALAALLAMAASAVLLFLDYRAEAANHRAVVLARAETTLDALTAGLRAHGRMGRYRHERLEYIFEELAHTPDILGVLLRGGDGAIIAGAGEDSELEALPHDALAWSPGQLRLSRTVTLEVGGQGPGRGQGLGAGRGRVDEADDWEPLAGGPHALALALDTTAMEAEIARDRLRGLATFAVAAGMAASAALALGGWVRRRDLLTDLLVAREQAAHQEHLTRLGAGLAHETKNPLGIIRGQAQLIADGAEDVAETQNRAHIIVDEIDRAAGQIDAFLKLARPRPPSLQAVALDTMLEGLQSLLADEAREKGVVLAVAHTDRVVQADEEQLRRALLNIALNALRASESGGRIDFFVEDRDGRAGVGVRDTGCGMAPDELARVTEPYFSRFEGGCGLGLALVQQIATAHGWHLDIQSEVGKGTTVTLRGMAAGAADGR